MGVSFIFTHEYHDYVRNLNYPAKENSAKTSVNCPMSQTSDTNTINKKDFTAKTVESPGASESVQISKTSSESYMDIGLLIRKDGPIGPDDGERRLKIGGGGGGEKA